MDTAQQIKARLDQLEAERLILTIELRNELLHAAKALLPEAIRQAKPQPARRDRAGKPSAATRSGKHHGGKEQPPRPGSPALLRLITRLAMRSVDIDQRPRRSP